jgi:hypothetical protein
MNSCDVVLLGRQSAYSLIIKSSRILRGIMDNIILWLSRLVILAKIFVWDNRDVLSIGIAIFTRVLKDCQLVCGVAFFNLISCLP